MSTAKKILSNTLAQIISKMSTAFLGVLTVKVLTSYLSVGGYGQYVYVYEFIAFFGIAADLGLFTIAVKEMSQDQDSIPEIIGNVLSIRTILIIAMMSLAVVTSFFLKASESILIPLGVSIASFSAILTLLNGTVSSLLQVKLKMEISSTTAVIGKIITFSTMLYIIFVGFPDQKEIGFLLLLAAGVFGNLIMFLSTSYYARKISPINYKFNISVWKKLTKESLPYGIALILNTIYFRLDSILISELRGDVELGIYGAAMKILEQFSVIPLYFMNSVLPVLTKAIKENSNRYKTIISSSFDFLAALALPIVVGAFVLAYPIIFVIANPDFLSNLSEGYLGSDIALQILIFALLFQFLNVLFAFILISVGEQKKLLYINAVCVLLNLITNIIFIPIYGFVGAAVTSVFCELFILIANYKVAKNHLHFSISYLNLFKITLASVLMGIFVHYLYQFSYKFIENWSIVLVVPSAIIFYGFSLFISGVLNKNLLSILKRKV